MPLVLNGATSGSTTIQATDAVTATLTLPSSTGTLLSTANPQSGGVIQAVSVTSNISVSTSSSSFVTTGITASISPKFSTSKILVIVSLPVDTNASSCQNSLTIYRNSTNLGAGLNNNALSLSYNTGGRQISGSSITYLDSPATTSSTTYTVYFASINTGTVNITGSGSTITLMEIAA